jgi:hypothetical protein
MLIMFILNLILIKKNIIKGGKIYIYIGKEETVICVVFVGFVHLEKIKSNGILTKGIVFR